MYSLIQKCVAEFFGTFVLTFCACGCAGGTQGDVVSTSLAFGLVIVAMAYSIGRVSGCHINPAVSIAFLILGQLTIIDFIGYIVSQIIGGLIGALAVFGFVYMSYDNPKLDEPNSYNWGGAANNILQYTERGFEAGNTIGSLLTEIVLTFIFVYVILNAAEPGNPNGNLAGFIIGGTLSLVVFVGINITGTSVNPARSLATAVSQVAYFDSHESIEQIWIWILGPMIGGALAPFFYKFLHGTSPGQPNEEHIQPPPIVTNKIECST